MKRIAQRYIGACNVNLPLFQFRLSCIRVMDRLEENYMKFSKKIRKWSQSALHNESESTKQGGRAKIKQVKTDADEQQLNCLEKIKYRFLKFQYDIMKMEFSFLPQN